MSELIPSVNWTDFAKIVKQGRISELKSCEVTFLPVGASLEERKLLFTAIIPHGDMTASDYARVQAEYLALRSNITGGKTAEEILNKETAHAAA